MRTPLLLLLLCIAPCAMLADEPPAGFKALFNGKDTTGWKVHAGKAESWAVENGYLVTAKDGGGWLMTEAEFSDFEFTIDYKLPKMANSGIALRSPMQGDPAYSGMEIQILDDPNWKGLRPSQHTGSIYDVVAASKQANRPTGEWNTMKIIAKGTSIQVTVNDEVIVKADTSEHEKSFAKHPGLKRERGHIGIQSHGGRIEFRNIFVKEISK